MAGQTVAGVGYHDLYFRWDISTPQPCIGRLLALPAHGSITQPGRTLFASRDRFGKWQHVLGPRHVMLAYVVQVRDEQIRRLEVQAHLGPEGEDDLCPVDEFPERYGGLMTRLALLGALPSEDPRVVRLDVAVDVVYEDPREGALALEALRFARWPRGWYAEWQGPPPYTTVAIKAGRRTVARAYCRNSKLQNGRPRHGKIRFERQQRFEWAKGLQTHALVSEEVAAFYWESGFGEGEAGSRVMRLPHELLAGRLIELVIDGALTTSQYEQLAGFLAAERLGLLEVAYSRETARRRRALARAVGVSVADERGEGLAVSLDEVLTAPRDAWGEGLAAAA
jgi:hypothetical protein